MTDLTAEEEAAMTAATTLEAQATFSQEVSLAPLVQAALVKAAYAVAKEPSPSASQVVAWRARRAFAFKVIENTEAYVERTQWLMAAASPALLEAYHDPEGVVTDADIEAAVASVWDTLTGV